MLKSASRLERLAETASAPVYPDDIEPAVQDTLAVLANIDLHYQAERERLEHWLGPRTVKERLAAELENAHRQEREPHVKLLGELHQRWMSATMFRGTLH
jgi:butyrate kinase